MLILRFTPKYVQSYHVDFYEKFSLVNPISKELKRVDKKKKKRNQHLSTNYRKPQNSTITASFIFFSFDAKRSPSKETRVQLYERFSYPNRRYRFGQRRFQRLFLIFSPSKITKSPLRVNCVLSRMISTFQHRCGRLRKWSDDPTDVAVSLAERGTESR